MPVYSLYSFHRTFIPGFEYLTPSGFADITELVYNLISFTFQYGSINTLKKTIEDNHFDLFTFQYGSINTDYRKNR